MPSATVGPLYRSLLEALESVAARDQVRSLLRTSLVHARLEVVPEQPEAFRRFVEGALTIGLEQTLGVGAAEMLREQLSHTLRMAAPAARRQATGTGDDETDELSGERTLDALPATSRPSGTATATLALHAPNLFPPRATTHESGTQRKRAAIARVSNPGTLAREPRSEPSVDVEEIRGPRSGPRAIATDVLVVTLDPRLSAEVETRLRGQSRVVTVVTLAELERELRRLAGQRLAVVLDTGVPSIDLPTFAGVASALPAGTHVVLWGTDDRQKRRLETMYPQARAWVASGAAVSPADLLLDE